jgi:IS5 family transposase
MGNMYKSQGKKSLFDEHFSAAHLSTMGNPLESISKVIDFEIFRSTLEDRLLNTSKKSNAGAKPFDVVMMFKILILQRYYNLGDKQVEYQIVDRASFKKFLGLDTGDKVPDEKTVWSFRERLTQSGSVEDLFELFVTHLEQKGLMFNEGQIIDASFTEIPRQRNTREENKMINDECGDDLWKDQPNKKCHKDIDARWTKKNGDTFYGYKNHVKVDSKSKIIGTYYVTDASVHDSQVLDTLLTKKDEGQELFADSAYTGSEQKNTVSQHGMINKIHEKGYKNKPLTEEQIAKNNLKSKTRVRVEHIFGFMERSMNGMYIWSVGMPRATAIIGLMNLTYNIFRYEQLMR